MRLTFAAAISGLLALAAPASAQVCSFSNTGINFGTLTVSSATNTSSTGTVTANCTGTRNRTITICPNIGSGSGGNDAAASRRYMTLGTERIEYNLYQNNGIGQIWGSHVWPFSPRPPAMSVALNNAGTGSATRTIYGRMFSSNVSSGVFTSVFSGGHTLFDYGYSPGFTCGTTVSSRAERVPFTVQVNSLGDCNISTTPLDFGTLENLATVIDAANTISVTCSRGVQYGVSLSNGTSGATNPAARMMKSTTTPDTVTYGIYTNAARTIPWGVNAFTGTGDGRSRTFTGYGRIPAQTTPAPATYSDNIVVTVTY
jgi:spore coat protein U-like protein